MLEEEEDAPDEGDVWTPLQIASSEGDLARILDLFNQGASPNELPTGYYGKTALQAASQQGHIAIVDVLLEAGVRVDAPGDNNGGRAALSVAAGAGQEAVVDRLISAGADVNLAPHHYMGRTPLQAAAESGAWPYSNAYWRRAVESTGQRLSIKDELLYKPRP